MMALATAHVDTYARDHLPPLETWPRLLLAPPTPHYPDRLNCSVELLDRAIEAGHGPSTAFIDGHEAITYLELAARVDRTARVLVDDLELIPGNRILIRSANNISSVVAWLAIAKAGGIVVHTMPLLRSRELQAIIEKAQIGLALCDHRLAAELEAATADGATCRRIVYFDGSDGGGYELERLAATKPPTFAAAGTAADDVVLIAFTSGTTGSPKATAHFHRDVLAICDTFSAGVLRPTSDDVFVGSPPIAFTFGLGGLVAFPMRAGARSVLLESASPEELVHAIEQNGATVLITSPTAYRRILQLGAAHRLGSLRKCVSAGETLPRTVFETWHKATEIRIIDGIGTTEMLHIFISSSEDDIRPGAVGLPVPGYEAKVVDESMQELPPGQVGRLAVRGPTGCRYLDDLELQRAYVVDGWNLTGDSFVKDEDGYFWYQARTDDMIITSGYNVAAPEVEAVVLEHDAVSDCAVIGVPDDLRGNSVRAYVVLAAGAESSEALKDELQAFVKERIAVYKCPRSIVFVPSLPRSATGKVQRKALRVDAGLFLSSAHSHPPARNETETP